MKYVRTHETRDKFLADKDSTSRGFRLAPTLYKYSDESEDEDNRDHIYLELDDPRKHEGSTYMEITLDSDVEFSFYIGNKSGDTQTTMTCTIDWGDDTIETKTITADDYGFKLAHNYVAGSYKIELYDVERDYVIAKGVKIVIDEGYYYTSRISHPSSVKRIVLGSGVVNIDDRAFYNCHSLTSIFIPESVNSIGDWVFYKCNSLTSIFIPKSVTRIEGRAFYGCSSLTSIYIPESVTIIEVNLLVYCYSLKSIYIPKSVTRIEWGAIAYCYSLKSIYIPESVTFISGFAFYECTSLTSVHIPESVTIIVQGAFASCTSLK